MVATNTVMEDIRSSAISELSSYTFVALGGSDDPPSMTQTELGDEVIRKEALEEDINLDTSSGTYSLTVTFGPAEAVGETIKETGLFDDSSNGNMSVRQLTNKYEKTSDKEIIITQEVSIEVVNE